MSTLSAADTSYRSVIALTGALFFSYLTVAMSLPAVPVHVVQNLGLGNAFGGLAVGIAFLSTILTRGWAGTHADRRGGKACMRHGLLIYAIAGLVCLASGSTALSSATSFIVLILGRLLLGLGESVAMIGMVGWAIGLMGPARSGRVMSLVGMGMYGAFAAGGPLGLLLLDRLGFQGLMVVCTILPLLGILAIERIPGVAVHTGVRESFWRILGRIWRSGAAVGLQGVGFAGLGAFFSLYFLSRHWPYAGLGLTFFGTGFVLVRLVCGHMPDRFGGVPVALVSLAVEAAGQFLLGASSHPYAGLAGALLTGLGCSMVFPAMGATVVKQVSPQLRGTAIGAFAAFQDLAYGATGPLAGLLADVHGYASVFLTGGVAASLGFLLVLSTRQIR